MPPPLLWVELFDRVELVSVAVPELKMPPPLPLAPLPLAELFDRVELVSVAVPELKMPPPLPLAELLDRVEAELLDRVELVSVSIAEPLLKIPPPLSLAELLDRVELVSVSIAEPLLKMPPPEPAELPPVIVRFSNVAVTPELVPMMRKEGVPAAVLRAMVTPTDCPAIVTSLSSVS